ncbi:MAG TPA: cation:proton antiporter [Methanocorpusculum sp.]|nr:cation:proton antiporter [Candidatus Methanocorpusculum faecipullorum]HJK35118.1 cation:proton antiporter [Methanocorpusculum sp.]HJK46752.1 cation:proton antiporter [Methanocorpusculum sp.]HJK52983.1 cation:proton antiporter [Methanocorpusculum sp.]HJK56077.1 cation:proton antiporter [Methanocorpusculum sp.]
MIDIFMIAAIIFVLLIFACGVRMWLGPTTADRMLALDVINALVVIIMIILSIRFEQPGFIDVAIVYALLSFVGTLYVAKLIRGDLE